MNDKPYEILSATKIKLGPDAKYWAAEYGMTLTQFAHYLLQADKLREAGIDINVMQGGGRGDEDGIEVTAGEEPRDLVADGKHLPPTQAAKNIEDRPGEAKYDPDFAEQVGMMGVLKPEHLVQHFGRIRSSPLASQLGFESVNRSPRQSQPFQGHLPPSYADEPLYYLNRQSAAPQL